MKRSTDRILTTHVGSLARPKDLLKMMDAKLKGRSYDSEAYDKRVRSAVTEVVRKQVECGVDIVTGFGATRLPNGRGVSVCVGRSVACGMPRHRERRFILQINEPSLTRLLISRTGNYDSTLL